jgi:beta-1,4-mannosyl-glycoprotein beta-1,4-N-acetylglucosaminyltransferase
MFSDADEIPKAETVRNLTKNLKYDKGVIADLCHSFFKSKINQRLFGKTLRKINPYVYVFEQSISAHFINLLLVDKSKWLGTRVCFYRDFTLADEIRYTGYKIIHDGGWHFTWMGGVERARLKLQSFAHNEYNKPEYLDEKNILNAIQNQKFFLDDKIKLKPVPLDNSFPDYILKHPERFPGWILPVK